MIAENIKKELLDRFTKELREPVTLLLFTDEFPSEASEDTRLILRDLSELSTKIETKIFNQVKKRELVESFAIDKFPSTLILDKDGNDSRIRFYGSVAGYELGSLVHDIVQVSRGETSFSKRVSEELKKLSTPVHIQVFVTSNCILCPKAVRLAHEAAMLNPLVKADCIEVTEFLEYVEKYEIRGVPKTVINEKVHYLSLVTEEEFLEYIHKAIF
ncbi:MAG: thioredoxin family protein [Blastocatellia bacterium]|nr:thioredoxin family protein [Blastocatellia bacterium]